MRRIFIASCLVSLAALPARAQDAGAAADVPVQPAPADGVATEPGAAPGDAPASAATGTAAEEAPLSMEELEALGLNTNQAGVDTSFQFSGFADFSVASQFVPKESAWAAGISGPPHSTFYIGNFNLYLNKNLTKSLRTMAEVRFSYLPNGTSDFLNPTRTSTAAADYSDYGRVMRWGGIEIERIYLEWTAHPLLSVRLGQFLTPYGVWNVDHGSPTYIPVQRPFVIGNSWFPERQTGVELFGRWDGSAASTLGYHLTLSNGTGPISEYRDLDENKAVGGRVFWEYRGLGELRVGGSGYYGRDTAATAAFTFVDGKFVTAETIEAQFDVLAWGADLSWKYRGWHLQSEWITYQRAYTRKGRTAQPSFGGPPSFFVDEFSWGMYALAGYRFSWLGVMPFAVFEHINGAVSGLNVLNATYQFGLNVRPVEMLALKLVYYHVDFFEGALKDDPLRMVHAQVAWAF
jgi:hypothetical protein